MTTLQDRRSPATTISEVIDRMREIDDELPRDDGVALFNRMYLKVTEAVSAAVAGTQFHDDVFLERLDVHFGNLFFEAVEQDRAGERITAAWRPLFEARHRRNTEPVQFALAGMNAHINHDLPVALVRTCAELDLTPDDETAVHEDFRGTNEVLGAVEGEIKEWFAVGIVEEIDQRMGKVDDAFAMWSIVKARDVAWANGQLLWSLNDNPVLRSAYLASLVRMVKLAGRGILL